MSGVPSKRTDDITHDVDNLMEETTIILDTNLSKTGFPLFDDQEEKFGLISPQKKKIVSESNLPKPKNGAFIICFYWLGSLTFVFLNKAVMVGDVINIDAPCFMTWLQFVIAALCCWIFCGL